eukprot:COSAG03_NODE_15696_length_423_cov_0.669753_1_plen_22_part_01
MARSPALAEDDASGVQPERAQR